MLRPLDFLRRGPAVSFLLLSACGHIGIDLEGDDGATDGSGAERSGGHRWNLEGTAPRAAKAAKAAASSSGGSSDGGSGGDSASGGADGSGGVARAEPPVTEGPVAAVDSRGPESQAGCEGHADADFSLAGWASEAGGTTGGKGGTTVNVWAGGQLQSELSTKTSPRSRSGERHRQPEQHRRRQDRYRQRERCVDHRRG